MLEKIARFVMEVTLKIAYFLLFSHTALIIFYYPVHNTLEHIFFRVHIIFFGLCTWIFYPDFFTGLYNAFHGIKDVNDRTTSM